MLAQRHGLDLNSKQVEQIMNLVGGHPFLIRLALYHLAPENLELERLLLTSATETSPFNNHLRRLLWYLQQQSNLLAAMETQGKRKKNKAVICLENL